MSPPTPGARLRALLARDAPLLVPQVLDPLSSCTAQSAGFQALYLGGGTLGYVEACTEIARTNACCTHGPDEALRRGEAYRRAGADMLLVLHRTTEEARAIGESLGGPLFLFMLSGPASPGMPMDELSCLGYYRIVCDALTPFYARQKAPRLAYGAMAALQPDPMVGAAFREEDLHVHEAIALPTLLHIERHTVER